MASTVAVRRSLLATTAAGALAATVAVRAPAQEPPEPEVRIEDPHGAMEHFYRRLAAAERGEPDALARVVMYAESTSATDRVTGTLRECMQDRFGDGGKGFVPIAPGWPVQRHRHVEWEQEGRWRTWVVNRRNGPLDRYGLGGVVATNRFPGASATFATASEGDVGTRVSSYQLYYQAWPEGGDVELRVDGGDPVRVDTRADEVEDRVHALRVPDGPHRLEVTAPGDPVRLYGVVMEREGPGVVVDGLMLVGAFTRVLLQFDEDHWARQVELRQPDLMIFWMGGNDAASRTTGFSHGRHVEQYSTALRRARQGRPEASCLVVSIFDQARRRGRFVRTHRRVPRVVRAQREAAAEAGCAFFDLYEAAGGAGTMCRWRRAGLAEGDYLHFTARGAARVGEILFRALVDGYERFDASDA